MWVSMGLCETFAGIYGGLWGGGGFGNFVYFSSLWKIC